MTDEQLTIGAMSIEIGVPVILAVALFIAPRLRPLCYSILGAITPLLFLYVSTIASTWDATDPAEKWAAGAMWAMSFFPYMVALVIGVLLGFAPNPKRAVSRFSLSAVVSICVLWVILSFA